MDSKYQNDNNFIISFLIGAAIKKIKENHKNLDLESLSDIRLRGINWLENWFKNYKESNTERPLEALLYEYLCGLLKQE